MLQEKILDDIYLGILSIIGIHYFNGSWLFSHLDSIRDVFSMACSGLITTLTAIKIVYDIKANKAKQSK